MEIEEEKKRKGGEKISEESRVKGCQVSIQSQRTVIIHK